MTLNFLDKLFRRSDNSSRTVAKNRLVLVLKHDRTDISDEMMQEIRTEIIKVLSRFLDIDEQALEVNIGDTGGSIALTASIPILRVRPDHGAHPDSVSP